MTKQEVLQKCLIVGNIVKLPEGQLDRKLYLEVAQSLELIGGKWKGGKVMGFVFSLPPDELLAQIANGVARNLKKEYQFFPTPDDIAEYMVRIAEVFEKTTVLEPSAGQGAFLKIIADQFPEKMIDCYEPMEVNKSFLKAIPTANLLGDDFLLADEAKKYDRIIANPPFAKNQDIDHVRKMWACLAKKGKIVTVASKHWQTCNNKKEKQFREWLEEIGASNEEIETGRFKGSGTMVSSVILTIKKV